MKLFQYLDSLKPEGTEETIIFIVILAIAVWVLYPSKKERSDAKIRNKNKSDSC